MVWSYSRITAFEDCPYKFFLKYIKKEPGKRHFFSDYGLFAHKILEKFYKGDLEWWELGDYYLTNFKSQVVASAPSPEIFKKYFKQGFDYFDGFDPSSVPEDESVIAVEKYADFLIGDKHFVGVIDKLSYGPLGLQITDHKSRALKKYSHKPKPTKSDLELDKYFRQLYLYADAVKQEYGEYPKELLFNCFRTGEEIHDLFRADKCEVAKQWALSMIDSINTTTEWKPNIDWFKCKYICDVCDSCEYFSMFCNGNDTKSNAKW